VPVPSWLKTPARRQLFRLGIEVDRFPRAQTKAGLLKSIFTAYDIDAVIDVGGGRGQFGSLVRSIGFHGPLISYEPLDAAFAELERHARKAPPWTVRKLALGGTSEVRALNVVVNELGDTGLHSLLPPTDTYFEFLPPEATRTTQTVRVEPLDVALAEEPAARKAQRIFLKTDTQGFDREVLRGAQGTLERVVGIQSELAVRRLYEGDNDWVPTISAIEASGFALSGLFPVAADSRLRLIEVDAIFVRP